MDFKRIKQECFWDYDISEEKLLQTLHSNDKKVRQKLFSKILYNSSDKLSDLQMFELQDLKDFFDCINIKHQSRYMQKHILILRSLLLGEDHDIKGLQWRKL
ncbi:MAG: hypothetical protein ACQESH_06010 [Campylobacterota bacterium]